MFLEYFDFFCNCISSIFETMKTFVLFDGFNYYQFFIALLAIPILFKLLYFIMGIEDEEVNFAEAGEDDYIPRYDSKPGYKLAERGSYKHTFLYNGPYKGRHRASYRDEYIPKHDIKGKHGK